MREFHFYIVGWPDPTVTYQLNPGYSMEEAHIYVGDFKPVTLAPGQYGHTAYFTPFAQTYTSSFSVTDSNNDGIWIIAHAVVYGSLTPGW